MGYTISPAEHIEYIRRNSYDDAKIKQLIEDGILDRKTLLSQKVLTQADLDRIYYVSPEEHMENINSNLYSKETIRGLLQRNEVNEAELIRRKILTSDQVDDILERFVGHRAIDFDWKDVPPLLPDRVDVFVLGIAGSGKSSFMAGLIYYAYEHARMSIDSDNVKGFLYAQDLIAAVQYGQTPPPTPTEYVQYMACDLMQENSRTPHPLTFVEMSGEIFQNSFGLSKEKIHPKFSEYLFDSPNNKIVFLTIDFEVHDEHRRMKNTQRAQFDYILKFFEKNGTLGNTEAICILINKWDLSADQSVKGAETFLKKEYLSLYRMCEDYRDKYKLKFEVFTFSLGTFDNRGRYTYEERDSAKLLDWLSSFSPVRRERRGWFR